MTQAERIKMYVRRRADGSLAFPRTVLAHIGMIMNFDNHLLTEADIKQINKFKQKKQHE